MFGCKRDKLNEQIIDSQEDLIVLLQESQRVDNGTIQVFVDIINDLVKERDELREALKSSKDMARIE